MAESEHLVKIVSNLSLDERQNLLEKLKSQSFISHDPLYAVEKDSGALLNIEEHYRRLPWYSRLWYSIMSIFKGRPPEKLYEDQHIAQLGQKINELSPGLFDYQSGKLLLGFHTQLDTLKNASRFFYTALDAGFNTDKGAFYAFLGSLEMSSVHSRLTDAVNPAKLIEKQPSLSQAEMRQASLRGVEEALKGISEDSRASMYYDARTLFCLKELSAFPYDRVLMAFSHDSARGLSCSINVIKEMLVNLNNILFSFKTIPPMTLLQSLFIFLLQERSAQPGFDINRETRGLLIKAEEALVVIRDFNHQVPLTKIIRCGSRNSSVAPQEISGGEDWYSVYRDHWKRQAEDQIALHYHDQRKRELFSTFGAFLNGEKFKTLDFTESDTNPDGFPLNGSMHLSFLLSFYSAVFIPSHNAALKLIMIDGDFGRRDNRIEYDDSYNGLIKLEDIIKKLENDISPNGDYGTRYAQAKAEMSPLTVKRRKIAIITDEASTEAITIVEDARRSIASMMHLLMGIISKDTTGKYFTLTNLDKLADKELLLVPSIEEAIGKFQKAVEILDEIDNLDVGQ